jgi:hypothetical protein
VSKEYRCPCSVCVSALYPTLAFSLSERSQADPATSFVSHHGLASEAALHEIDLTYCSIAVLFRASLSIRA